MIAGSINKETEDSYSVSLSVECKLDENSDSCALFTRDPGVKMTSERDLSQSLLTSHYSPESEKDVGSSLSLTVTGIRLTQLRRSTSASNLVESESGSV